MPANNVANKRAGLGFIGGAAAGGALLGAGLTLAGLAGGGTGADAFSGQSITFPDNLATIDHWVSFTAMQTKGGISEIFGIAIGSNATSPGGSVYLPLPANLSTDYNPEYTNKELGAGPAGQAAGAADRAIYQNNDIPGLAAAGAALASAFTSAASKMTGVLGDAALKAGGGVAQNPHKIVLFTGVDFRTHSFSWKLSPKNRYESDSIRSIIEFFRYYSHPEYVAGGLFFKYPEYFQINFSHPDYLFNIKDSVCTDMKVNYHTHGYPSYVRNFDGSGAPAPTEVELTLSFRETDIVTKNSLNPPGIPAPLQRRNVSGGGNERGLAL